MYEVKADTLAASFDAIEQRGVVTARPVLSGAMESGERRAFVDGYLRRGVATELKSFNGASGIDGGYAIPKEIDTLIERTLRAISPIRAIANVVQVGSSGYRKLVTSGGTPSGWVAETAGRPETETPDFHEIAPPMGELYANPAASQVMLDDAASMSKPGWPTRSRASSRRRRGRRSCSATAPASPRAFWPGRSPRRATRCARSARCNMSPRARRGRLPRAIRRTG